MPNAYCLLPAVDGAVKALDGWAASCHDGNDSPCG